MSLCPSCNTDAGEVAKFCPSCGTSILRGTSNGDDYTGRIIAGKFRVERLLGEGGMGKVYKATQLSLDKTVVLKVLRQSLLSDSRTVARFQREAKAASRLNHPNSIGVIDFGQGEDGAMFIAMEYVSGQDLHQVLALEGPLPESRIVRIVSQVLSALTEAHSAGVIHRDLKPENIMVEQRRGEPDFVKVLDFGIAKITESDGTEGQALTRAGFVCGTPEYMSPEQARGAVLDSRSDLYAVGVIMYQCATNQLPFESDSAVGFATKHLTEEPVPPRKKRPDAFISDGMEALILKAMAKDPNDRLQSAEEFRQELLALMDPGERTNVASVPPSPRRATGSSRRAAAPPPEDTAVGSQPSWATQGNARGQARKEKEKDKAPVIKAPVHEPEEESTNATNVVTNPGPGDGKVERRGGRSSNLTVFVGAAFAAAVLGGLALIVSGAFSSRPADEPRKPDPLTEDRSVRPLPIPSSVRDPEAAQALAQKAEAALQSKNLDDALSYSVKAWEKNPSPGNVKRVALAHLARNEPKKAAEWLSRYQSESPDAPDQAYVRGFLDSSKKPEGTP